MAAEREFGGLRRKARNMREAPGDTVSPAVKSPPTGADGQEWFGFARQTKHISGTACSGGKHQQKL